METDQLGRLRDILEAARLIALYVADTTDTAFRTDTQKQDAVTTGDVCDLCPMP